MSELFVCWAIAALPHLVETMNGANGMSDIEGKAKRRVSWETNELQSGRFA
jgi:hypothetical protein